MKFFSRLKMKKGVKHHLQQEDMKPLPVQVYLMLLMMILRVLDVQMGRQ